MTKTSPIYEPLTWTVKLITRSIMDVLSMTHSAPFAPESVMKPKPFNEPSIKITDSKIANSEEFDQSKTANNSKEKEKYQSVDLDGYQFRFFELPDLVEVKRQEYQLKLTDHPLLGTKLLPSGDLAWITVARFPNLTLVEAIEEFIKSGFKKNQDQTLTKPIQSTVVRQTEKSVVIDVPKVQIKSESDSKPKDKPTIGTLIFMGEKDFPDLKYPGKTYQNFAITLKTGYGEKPLQGEGLRDALAECHAKINDKIKVQRLDQIEVQCIDKRSQKPIFNEDGSPKMGKKWQWSITVLDK